MAGTPQYPADLAVRFAELEKRFNALAASAQTRIPFTQGTLTGNLSVGGTLTVGGVAGGLVVTGGLAVDGANFFPTLTARKTAPEVRNNNTTLADDGHLTIPVEANTAYLFESFLLYATDPAADIKLQFTGPAGATLDWGRGGMDSGTTTTTTGASKTGLAIASAITLGGVTSNVTKLFAMPRGTLVTSGTAGLFTLQWAQQALVASDSTLYAQSWIRLQRCP